MDRAQQADDCGVSTIAWSRGRFRIAYPAGVTSDRDPVAAAYRDGHIGHLASLLEVATAVLRPGDRVLDLGAHLGGFALAAAGLGCRVIAVEAAPQNAALLRRSVAENEFTNLRVVHAAVGDRPGSIRFYAHGPWGHVLAAGDDKPAVSVPCVRAEDLVAEHGWDGVRFVKLDVEGSELAAFRGMAGLLRRPDAPVLFFESNLHSLRTFGLSDADLKGELRALGYALYRPTPDGLTASPEGEPQEDVVVDYVAAKGVPAAVRLAA
jgi:FkbM family methyltransferase